MFFTSEDHRFPTDIQFRTEKGVAVYQAFHTAMHFAPPQREMEGAMSVVNVVEQRLVEQCGMHLLTPVREACNHVSCPPQ